MPDWRFVGDSVMGGVSQGRVTQAHIVGREALRLTGQVSLDNNGGFLQMAADLAPEGAVMDASGWSGIEMDVLGNGESYDLRLRTDQLSRPWQSYRADLSTTGAWQSHRFHFAEMAAHRTDIPFDPARLRRIGVLAVGRAMDADIAVAGLRLYR